LVTAVGVTAVLMMVLSAVIQPLGSVENFSNPLSPPDTESPRATLESFKWDLEAAEQLITDTYKEHIAELGWFMSDEVKAKESRIQAHFDRAMRCFDLSNVPPANRTKTGMEAAMLVAEIFDRVTLPSLEYIPDKVGMKALTDKGERAQ
jgi:MscS family membrane protein